MVNNLAGSGVGIDYPFGAKRGIAICCVSNSLARKHATVSNNHSSKKTENNDNKQKFNYSKSLLTKTILVGKPFHYIITSIPQEYQLSSLPAQALAELSHHSAWSEIAHL